MIETLRKMLAEAQRIRAEAEKVPSEDGSWHAAYRAKETLYAAAVNALPALLDAAEAWRDYLSAQRTIDDAGQMDNYTDAARARKRQAKAIDRARRALAALAGRE